MNNSSLKDYRLAPLSGTTPDSAVIFLHGLGDSGSGGLLEICRMWQSGLPRTEFLCPDAPHPFDMAPPDFGGRQWFSLHDFSQQAMDEGVLAAAPILNDYIDGILTTRKLKPARLALAGFSQGTMMALHVGLRRAEPLASILGYSGMLTNTALLAREKATVTPPVLLAHGTQDEVVPFAAMGTAAEIMKKNSIAVETLARPGLGHSIDEAGIAAGFRLLQRSISALDN
ncbi:MAG: dienelactone hydrolase family protein [Alphaproteobacteria bacterium]|nr:dienelactone hydrolase family protein [Alphaproteobacteria bacterium]